MILHCHHYNTFLQRSILDAPWVNSKPTLVGAGHEVASAQLRALFAASPSLDTEARRQLAQRLYRWAGFGTFDLSAMSGPVGTIRSASSHYALGWRVKFGGSSQPVCHFASGWLAGALEAIHDLPVGSLRVEERSCASMSGQPACTFEITRDTPTHPLFKSPGVGPLTNHAPVEVTQGAVDYEGILTGLSGRSIEGDDHGNIEAFGVLLTRHYANYYNRISFEFERATRAAVGDEVLEAVEALLVEAGHVCAFHTFGGIMESTEWDALVRPSLRTREDWVHGMIAAVNALGWGRWQVTSVSEAGAEFVLHDDYESVGHLAMYGRADHPVSYLAQGGVAGLMNLVYVGDIASAPRLDIAFYDTLFRHDDVYRAKPGKSRAMGDDVTTFTVVRG